MMAHTPGPWWYNMESYMVMTEERGEYICEVSAPYHRESIHNANLIVAAPDLLSALRNIVSMAEAAHWDKATTGRQLLLDDAKKAILKAEGKE